MVFAVSDPQARSPALWCLDRLKIPEAYQLVHYLMAQSDGNKRTGRRIAWFNVLQDGGGKMASNASTASIYQPHSRLKTTRLRAADCPPTPRSLFIKKALNANETRNAELLTLMAHHDVRTAQASAGETINPAHPVLYLLAK